MKKQKTNLEIFKAFMKSNKVRREKLANKAGFNSVEKYKAYLKDKASQIDVSPEPKTAKKVKKKVSKKKKTLPTIHVVDVVDCSYSMSGSKLLNANEAINTGLSELKENAGKEVNYTYTLCRFSDSRKISFPQYLSKVTSKKAKLKELKADGMTALYDAIGRTFSKLEEDVTEGEKVLINIYTDGGENGSVNFYAHDIKLLIANYKSKGYTVTFIGTAGDVSNVNMILGIDESNSLVYDGSSRGLKGAMNQTLDARKSYSKSVSKGEDVSKGFYKKMTKKL